MGKRFDNLDPEERELASRVFGHLHCPPFDQILAVQAGVLEDTRLTAHLATCRFCQALVTDFTQGESASPTPQNLDHVRARLDKGIAAVTQPTPWWRQWHVLAAIAGAAACLAIAITVNTDRKPTPPPIAQIETPKPQFRLPLTAPPVKLSVGTAITWRSESPAAQDTYLKELGAALAPYRAANYAEAATKLAAISAQYPQSPEAAFYLAVSLLHQNQPEAARAALEKAAALKPQNLHDEVQWFLGVAWERTGNKGQAAARLKALCDTPGPYHDQACTALPLLR